jgi:hypothetical protein
MTTDFSGVTNAVVGMAPPLLAAKVVSDIAQPRERGRVVRIKRQERKGKLTHKQRELLPDTDFALPKERKYPIENISHARNALARVSAFGTAKEKHEVREAIHERYPEINEEYEHYSHISLKPRSDIKLIKMHDDGDMTIKKDGKLFVKTTDGRTFQEVPASRLGKMHTTKRGGFTRRRGIK